MYSYFAPFSLFLSLWTYFIGVSFKKLHVLIISCLNTNSKKYCHGVQYVFHLFLIFFPYELIMTLVGPAKAIYRISLVLVHSLKKVLSRCIVCFPPFSHFLSLWTYFDVSWFCRNFLQNVFSACTLAVKSTVAVEVITFLHYIFIYFFFILFAIDLPLR